jgi:hypothetical protein
MTTTSRSELYNGRVILEFKEAGHKYIIHVDGVKVKSQSVTTITGVVDKSGPIQGWAVKETLKVAKSLIEPGKYYSESELADIWEKSRKASYVKKQEAADVGTITHEWLKLYFQDQQPELPPEDHPSRSCVQAALSWIDQHNVKIMLTERPIFSIKHNVSGRLDAIAEIDGVKSLLDFKSGNGIYSEMRFQTAAYQGFYTEETGEEIQQRAIIRLGKEDGKFYQRIYPQESFEADFNGFLAALNLYRRLREAESEDKKIGVTSNKGDWLDEL